ncbi:MAG TPA: hypothetical protein VHB73_06725 [Alphaproteobacteria bacterium]|nr:hypothetical protein [Alphaproteobacteria bacterium]
MAEPARKNVIAFPAPAARASLPANDVAPLGADPVKQAVAMAEIRFAAIIQEQMAKLEKNLEETLGIPLLSGKEPAPQPKRTAAPTAWRRSISTGWKRALSRA